MYEKILHSGDEKYLSIYNFNEFYVGALVTHAVKKESDTHISFHGSLNGHSIIDTGLLEKSEYDDWRFELKEV